MIYDFLILTAGRAGSHLLASFLNSHPDVACEGEIGKEDSLIARGSLSGDLKGCILPYAQRDLLKKYASAKVIHMWRDPDRGAYSYQANIIRYRARMRGEPYVFAPALNTHQLRSAARRLRAIHDHCRKLLVNRPYLNVSYEELSDGGNAVDRMPNKSRAAVCDFLGIKNRVLSTEMLKRSQTE